MKIASSLLVLGTSLGCYVQPYNPPPAQVAQTQQVQQPDPYAQQPPPDQYGQQPPPPAGRPGRSLSRP